MDECKPLPTTPPRNARVTILSFLRPPPRRPVGWTATRRRVDGAEGAADVEEGTGEVGEAAGERRAPRGDHEMPRVGNVPVRVPSNAIDLGVTYLCATGI